MEIIVKGLASGYEVENLARVFFAGALMRKERSTRGDIAYARVTGKRLAAGLRYHGKLWLARRELQEGETAKLALCQMLYALMREATGMRPPWGMLTGVRPVRLLCKALEAGGEAAAEQKLKGVYDVSPEKYELVRGIARVQQPYAQQMAAEESYSLYVSIPFCPTRCAYCSFVSRTIEREAALVQAYLEHLERELAATAEQAARLGLRLHNIYIGGGTPTALSHKQLEQLLRAVERLFGQRGMAEYTVEAGRPDCTDYNKLEMLTAYGVGRISINPQSMDDDVLREIGRRHSAADVVRCFEDARRAGHSNINMDIIAGLPKDTPEGFERTLETLLGLAPENLTVHTLTLKRASDLVVEGQTGAATLPERMIEAAYPQLQARGYKPYYLYRQKKTLQNLENTGWAKPGTEGLYNIAIMEELHSILAVGAGASSKVVRRKGGYIRRFFNPKFPLDYIEGFEAVLDKKRGLEEAYACDLDT